MKGEGDGKAPGQAAQIYLFRRCHECKIKLHVDSRACWKCGRNPENIVYRSHNPEDAIYGAKMNNADLCMGCWAIKNGGKPCEPIMCFGTARGRCDLCRRLEGTRFDCCQEYQKKNGLPPANLAEAFREITGNKTPGPLGKTMERALKRPQYDDEIPF